MINKVNTSSKKGLVVKTKGVRREKIKKEEEVDGEEVKLVGSRQEKVLVSVDEAVSRINKFFGDDKEQGEKDELRKWVKDEKARCASVLTASDLIYAQAVYDGTDREKALIASGVRYDDLKAVGADLDSRVESYVQVLRMERDIEMNMTRVDILRLWGALACDGDVKASDRLRASELIAKVKGMFVEHEMAKAPVVNITDNAKLMRLASVAYQQWKAIKEGAQEAILA